MLDCMSEQGARRGLSKYAHTYMLDANQRNRTTGILKALQSSMDKQNASHTALYLERS